MIDLGIRAFVVEQVRLLAFVIAGFVIGFTTGPTVWRGLVHEVLAGLVGAIPLVGVLV